MEYQIIINQTTQPFKFRTKNLIEIMMIGMRHMTRQIFRFKTTLLNASLCDCSDAYILVEGKIAVVGQGANDVEISVDKNEAVDLKNCTIY